MSVPPGGGQRESISKSSIKIMICPGRESELILSLSSQESCFLSRRARLTDPRGPSSHSRHNGGWKELKSA